MADFVFATNNRHKLEELSALFQHKTIRLLSLSDIGCVEELPETSDTLEGNSLQKARYVYDKYGKNCFADDTGLEVFALDGKPGVYSARYAGPEKSAELNILKLLKEMEGVTERKARFRTVIALAMNGDQFMFEGAVNGVITREKRGSGGFGYDSVFLPDGSTHTFAEMALTEKNRLSHRARAVEKLAGFLNSSA